MACSPWKGEVCRMDERAPLPELHMLLIIARRRVLHQYAHVARARGYRGADIALTGRRAMIRPLAHAQSATDAPVWCMCDASVANGSVLAWACLEMPIWAKLWSNVSSWSNSGLVINRIEAVLALIIVRLLAIFCLGE